MIFFCQSARTDEPLTVHTLEFVSGLKNSGLEINAIITLRGDKKSYNGIPICIVSGTKLTRLFKIYFLMLGKFKSEGQLFFYQNGFYALILSPLLLFKYKFFQWISHPSPNFKSAISAYFLCKKIFTVNKKTFPFHRPNISYVGLSINSIFLADTKVSNENLKFLKYHNLLNKNYSLYLGRIAKVKNIEEIMLVANQSHTATGIKKLVIAGPSITSKDREHINYLKNEIVPKLTQIKVIFLDEVTRTQAKELFRLCAFSYCFSRTATDKTVYECLAVGRPVFCTNPVFLESFNELKIPYLLAKNTEGASEKIIKILENWENQDLLELRNKIKKTFSTKSLGHRIAKECKLLL